MSAGIEPRYAAADQLHPQCFQLQITPIHVGDLEFPTSRWAQLRRDIEHSVVVEVESGHGIARFRRRRLFLDPQHPPMLIEMNYTIALRILDVVRKDSGSIGPLIRSLEL